MRYSHLRWGVFLIGLFSASAFAEPIVNQNPPPQLMTHDGPLIGVEQSSTITFQGIPYAAPPIGALRWVEPQAPKPWITPLNATSFGNECLQPALIGPFLEGSEDCLTLNVWRPKQASPELLPVLFFIHGGENAQGSASSKLLFTRVYDGSYLSSHGNVVVVTINYRLGNLGFLGHPALTAESPHQSSGNFGMLDQLQALRWVQDNVSAFGGDPARVTLFGESAGAIDILALIASPLAKGLFSQAIVESGFLTEYTKTESEKIGLDLATRLSCDKDPDVLKCLRSKSAHDLIEAEVPASGQPMVTRYPTIDGYLLNEPVLKSFQNGNFNHVPILIGTNADEMTILGPVFSSLPKNNEDLKKQVNAQYGENFGSVILGLYPTPSNEYPNASDAYEGLGNDTVMQCPNRKIARAFFSNGVPVYKYLFSHVSDDPLLKPWRAGHGFELPYVFHAFYLPASSREQVLSDQMVNYWTAFAKNGNPQFGAQPEWPQFTGEEYLNLNVEPVAELGYRDAYCDFWEGMGLDRF